MSEHETEFIRQMSAILAKGKRFYRTTVWIVGICSGIIVTFGCVVLAQGFETTKTSIQAIEKMETLTYRAIKSYCEQRRQKGWKVIVCTEINCTDASLSDSRRLAFNTLVRNNWTGFADYLCDLGNTSPFNTATSHENLTYYLADGVHLTATGYQLIANAVSSAIISFAASSKAEYKSILLQIYDPSTDVTAGTDIARISIPYGLDGWKVSKVEGHSYVSSGGDIIIQIRKSAGPETMAFSNVLSSRLYVKNAYYDSKSYYDPTDGPTEIDANYSTMYEGYVLTVDITYSSSGRKGLDLRLDFSR